MRNALVRKLKAAGAEVRKTGSKGGAAAFVVDLTALGPDWRADCILPLFERVRDALVAGADAVIIACTAKTRGGIAGMCRALAKEWPEREVRAVVFDDVEKDSELADAVLAELAAGTGSMPPAHKG